METTKAPESNDPINQAGTGVNWLVGLSGAAIGGALARIEWILKLPATDRAMFFVTASLYLMSVVTGAFYAFQLIALRNMKLKQEAETWKIPRDDAALKEVSDNLTHGRRLLAWFHYPTMILFFLAGVGTVASLATVLFISPPPPPPEKVVASNHYTISTVSVYSHGKVLHTHTFLLNQQTGQIWMMHCSQAKGRDMNVEFQRVKMQKLDGTVEDQDGLEKLPTKISPK